MVSYSPVNAVDIVDEVLSREGDGWWISRGIHVEKRWKRAVGGAGLVERFGLLAGECGRSDLDDGFGVGAEPCVCG